jgi:hypothetical protein
MWTGSGACGSVFANRLPGGLGGASRRKTDAQGSFLTPSRSRKANRGQRASGAPRSVQTPQWSAVRRGRPIARLVPCCRISTDSLRAIRRSAPSFWERESRSFGSGIARDGRKPPAGNRLRDRREHGQAKWRPVRRPDMRPRKTKHARNAASPPCLPSAVAA